MAVKKMWGKKARNRQVIMNAAKKFFERDGVEHVTFNDIAKEAGMSRTTIFNHFPTINDLMLALAEQEFIDIMDYYETTQLQGRELIMAMYNRLIDDTCDYSALSTRLISTMLIMESERQVFRKFFIDTVVEALDSPADLDARRQIAIMLCGNYLGLVSTNFFEQNEFDRNQMKRHFAHLAYKIF